MHRGHKDRSHLLTRPLGRRSFPAGEAWKNLAEASSCGGSVKRGYGLPFSWHGLLPNNQRTIGDSPLLN